MDENKNIPVGEKSAEVKEELFTKAQVDELMEKEREGWVQKLREAEKLAQMNAAEKADYQRTQFEKSLSDREKAVSRRELMADAAERLSENNLPKSLISCVNLSSPEECEKSIEGIKTAFADAVAFAVTERIKGSAPRTAAAVGKDAFLDGLYR